jgi:hypothetical protein
MSNLFRVTLTNLNVHSLLLRNHVQNPKLVCLEASLWSFVFQRNVQVVSTARGVAENIEEV